MNFRPIGSKKRIIPTIPDWTVSALRVNFQFNPRVSFSASSSMRGTEVFKFDTYTNKHNYRAIKVGNQIERARNEMKQINEMEEMERRGKM